MPRLAEDFPADVEFLNREMTSFLDVVTDGGKKLD